ncbi:pppGpp 5'-phosphohydrolase and exopolyphosphatase [Desulfuromonas sp. DDH964]|uniref:Ppx/GppA phosphatase family protein n=1 Tax=Desulfuromonas sp. DDH964 TaxID=1823759 RepID=UPI00078DE817|nr:Ppx/GppA phosphatase family protein [Desulfuromonas sp. DDH964]AMV72281.1 pppGpp 5'-phosphohydrolase and exopolyphosphatase [Desulfuromonas sp. DDH964]
MFAAIDVGSNTVRMLLASVTGDGSLLPLHYFRKVTRLGGGITSNEGLASEAMERTLLALQQCAAELATARVDGVAAVGTAALRRAKNGKAFVARIQRETGLVVDVVDGEKEAYLAATGVLAALDPKPSHALIFDIGGGSTEFILVVDGKHLFYRSYPLGVVSLCEEGGDPSMQYRQIETCLDALQRDLRRANLLDLIQDKRTLLVGTAGTVTTLAALQLGMEKYDWRRVNNLLLTQHDLQNWARRLGELDVAERERLPGLEKGRGDLILPGVMIVLQLLRLFSRESLTVSDFGLLEGLLLEHARITQRLD